MMMMGSGHCSVHGNAAIKTLEATVVDLKAARMLVAIHILLLS
jgi:hypothetical protein